MSESCQYPLPGQPVTVRDGTFAGMEATVLECPQVFRALGRVRVQLTIFGRAVPVEVTPWELDWRDPLTEAEWLACPRAARLEHFLRSLPQPPGPRRWRLFACACARRVCHLLPEAEALDALATAELYADRRTAWRYVRCAVRQLRQAVRLPHGTPRSGRDWRTLSALQAVQLACGADSELHRARLSALEASQCPAEPEYQRALLRCVFGNPFRPATWQPDWLAWNASCVAHLARLVDNERRFDEMPVLADALEDAGCADAHILAHCRGGEHARGCWVLDGLLGRA